MIEPPADHDDVRRFADRLAGPGAPPDVPAAPVARGGLGTLKAGARKAVKRVAAPVTTRLLARMTSIANQAADEGDHSLRRRLDVIELDLRKVEHDLDTERELVLSELDVGIGDLRARTDSQHEWLDAFGYAVAPSAGLPGAVERFSEIRSRVNLLSREVEALRAGAAPVNDRATPAPDRERPSTADPAGLPPFDYVGFEQRFRGTSEELMADIASHYGDILRGGGVVLDVGCGRGELLEIVAAAGGEAIGVDLDADAAEVAAAKPGLQVHLADALVFLQEQPPGSFDVITAIQVVEHLEFDDVRRLVDLAIRGLRPGGWLVLETPNPTTLSVLGNSFILDPTHVRPLHPSLLTFVCERAGFAEIDVRYYAPLDAYHLPVLESDAIGPATEGFNEAIRRLNHVLFGPQDFAIVARAPGRPSTDE